MRKFFVAAMGSVVALAGFAGAANASATLDLIWIDVSVTASNGFGACTADGARPCPNDPRSTDGVTLSSSGLTTSDSITLAVVVTAGPKGVQGGGVSVDYSDALPKLSVGAFRSLNTFPSMPDGLGTTIDTGSRVQNINSACCGPLRGIGLFPGNTAYLGTVRFNKDTLENGSFTISVDTNGPGNALLSLNPLGVGIPNNTIAFNSAFLVNVPEPGALSLLVMGLGGMLLAGRGRS